MKEKYTQVIAHRGSKGTRPENTLASFQEAINAEQMVLRRMFICLPIDN